MHDVSLSSHLAKNNWKWNEQNGRAAYLSLCTRKRVRFPISKAVPRRTTPRRPQILALVFGLHWPVLACPNTAQRNAFNMILLLCDDENHPRSLTICPKLFFSLWELGRDWRSHDFFNISFWASVRVSVCCFFLPCCSAAVIYLIYDSVCMEKTVHIFILSNIEKRLRRGRGHTNTCTRSPEYWPHEK